MLVDALTAVPVWVVSPVLRRWHMRWGAATEELTSAMPGDEVVPRAQFNATRAITIGARPEEVGPWIVQLGYGRGGFYTYDLIDNGGLPSADRIIGTYQDLKAGDLIPMFHESHGLAIAYKVDAFSRNEWMLWVYRPHEGRLPTAPGAGS